MILNNKILKKNLFYKGLVFFILAQSFVSHGTQERCDSFFASRGVRFCISSPLSIERVTEAWDALWSVLGESVHFPTEPEGEVQIRVFEGRMGAELSGVFEPDENIVWIQNTLLRDIPRLKRLLAHELLHFLQHRVRMRAPSWFLEVQAIALEETIDPNSGAADIWRYLRDPRGIGLYQAAHISIEGAQGSGRDARFARRGDSDGRIYGLWNLWGRFLEKNCFENRFVSAVWSAALSGERFDDPWSWIENQGEVRCQRSLTFEQFVRVLLLPRESTDWESPWTSSFRGEAYARDERSRTVVAPHGSFAIFERSGDRCARGEWSIPGRKLGLRTPVCVQVTP